MRLFSVVWPYALATLIGAGVGLSELLSRYSWTIRNICSSAAGWAYLAINGAAALLAYLFAVDWGFDKGLTGKPEGWRVLAVSLLAMVFLRSSLATIRIGDREVGVGLVSLVEVFLRRAEKVLDQGVSRDRWTNVGARTSELTYDATRAYFVTVAESLLRSLNDTERDSWHRELTKIDESDVDADTKMRLLAICIADRLGDDLFATIADNAKQQFADAIGREKRKRETDQVRLAELKVMIAEQKP